MRNVRNAVAGGHAERPQRKGERGGGVARRTDVACRPTAAHRGRCALRRVGNVSALQIRCPSSGGRGVGDAAPYGVCERVCFSGAVRWADCLGIVSTPVASYSARPVSLLLVGCTVLGAPWSRDRRGYVGADGRRDRLHPRFPRRVRLASTTQRIQSRGHSPRTICRREGTTPVASYAATFVSLTPVGGGVLDAPCVG